MAGLVGGPDAPAAAPAMPDPSQFDPSKYMQAMSGMFSNPAFMQMAEQLGQAIISVGVELLGCGVGGGGLCLAYVCVKVYVGGV